MFELVFLGTSASAPSIKRGLSSLIVKHDEHRFMVDCGEGTQRQILKSGVGFKDSFNASNNDLALGVADAPIIFAGQMAGNALRQTNSKKLFSGSTGMKINSNTL